MMMTLMRTKRMMMMMIEAAALLRHTTNCAPAQSISVSREPAPKHFSIGKLFSRKIQIENISELEKLFLEFLATLVALHFTHVSE